MALMTELTKEDCVKTEKFFKEYISPNNPMADLKLFEQKLQPMPKSDNQHIQELTERIDALENMIKLTFGGHVLINGEFVKIKLNSLEG